MSVRTDAKNADDYKQLEQIEHIYKVPDMYIGSCEKETKEEWIFSKNTIIKEKVSLPEGISRLFLEILSNAGDATSSFKMGKRGDELKIPPIQVKMTKEEITITNSGHELGGHLIPIEVNKQTQKYVPEMIFGNLLTSSNYDENVIRLGCGRNGLGAKLVNIFSKKFTIIIIDHPRHLKYTQTWTDNMSKKEDFILEKTDSKISSVSISYVLDFKRFKYQKYPDEAFSLFARYCSDISLGGKIDVIFNDKTFSCSNIKNFAELYFDEQILENSVVNKRYPLIPPKGMTKKTSLLFPESEFMIIFTPDAGSHISIVNGLMTKDGGVHVQEAYKAISEIILPKINSNSQGVKITMNDIKPHITIILSCRLLNPTYGSQTKTVLNSPTPVIEIEKGNIAKILSWKLIDDLRRIMEFKENKALKKTDGTKKRHVNSEKVEDANFAGTDKAIDCTLILIEGDSARSYATKAISLIPDGMDYYGTFPLGGKPLNIRNASIESILKSDKFSELKEVIGLRENMDYSVKENMNTLRYGKIYLMVDADVDGKHIAGLIYDLFECHYPSLLKNKYIYYYRTPIIRVKKDDFNKSFHSMVDFEQWKKITSMKNYSIEYYKGLGTSSNADIVNDMSDIIIAESVYDDKASESLKLAFDDDLADLRKIWIENYRSKNISIETQRKMNLSDFINEEFVTFCIANVERSLPSLIDGLKPSQRKLLYSLLKNEHGYKDIKKIKTAKFASSTAGFTNYHHGEQSLCQAINVMTQTFVGANNLGYFKADGQFGSRNQGGKDAASERYTFIRPEWWLKYIFREEDLEILKYIEEEGMIIEPENFAPIIPMGLVNGCCGIGTGHSTFIPCYNPVDICKWLKNRLGENIKIGLLKPWYRGFKGKIEFRNIEAEGFRDEMETNPDFIPPKGCKINAMVTKGDFEIFDKDVVRITELPIGRWYHNYEVWIKKMIKERQIKDYRKIAVNGVVKVDAKGVEKKEASKKGKSKGKKNDLEEDCQVEFELKGVRPEIMNHKDLGLIKPFSVGNMVMLENGRPKKYKTVEEILEKFYEHRIGFYQKRKDWIINEIEKDIRKNTQKRKFIKLELEGLIVIRGQKRSDVLKRMAEFDLEKELLGSVSIGNFCEDEILDLDKKIEKLGIEKERVNGLGVNQMWINDIDEFLVEYGKRI